MSEAATSGEVLPVGSIERKALGLPGMVMLIMTEGALFAYLLFGYYYLYAQHGRAFLPSKLPEFALSVPNTVLLLLSSVGVWWGERAIRRGAVGRALLGLAIGIVLGAVFVGIQVLEWRSKDFTLASSPYGSVYFITTGFHMAHVVAGLLMLIAVLAWTGLGLFDRVRHAPVSIAGIYWHFVDAVWLVIFFTIYVTPRLG